jgi:TonB family protein
MDKLRVLGERVNYMHSSVNKSMVVIVCLAFCFLIAVYAQQPAEEPDSVSQGIALYKRGDTQGAIKVLREAVEKSKGDSSAWHYLGLSFIQQGNLKEAREALGKAIDLRNRSINLEFSGKEGEWRDDQLVNFKTLLADQIESQSKVLETFTDKQAVRTGELALERTRVRADCVEQNIRLVDGHTVLRKNDLRIERARVLSKPEPGYPESARRERVNGTVILKAMFVADASVQFIELVKSPDSRLTEAAIRAAQLIRFRPETICGKPISSPIRLEYRFLSGW